MRRRDLEVMTVREGATVRSAIESIQAGRVQAALVVDGNGRLIGTVTDGDIRRGLLAGNTLESPVVDVMNRQYRAVSESATDREVLDLMRHDVLHQVPVLDGDGCPSALAVLDDLLGTSTLPNTVVLMAGGEGIRLRPLTTNRPKPMLDVAGRPMLELILQACIDEGLVHFLISVNYLKQQVMDYFGDGSRWGVQIDYLIEDEALGTAGALGLIHTRPTAPLLVINGDVLTRVSFRQLLEYHVAHTARATVCARPHETRIPFGVISSDGMLLSSIDEKPIIRHYVNAGLYVLDPDVLPSLTGTVPIDMPELLQQQRDAGHDVLVFPIHEYWQDLGTPEAIAVARDEWQ